MGKIGKIHQTKYLHKKWKNELGPVAKEHRKLLWKRFQIATKIIQKNRKEFQKNAIKSIKNNLIVREVILKKMKSHLTENLNNHNDWQQSLINFNKLREEFKAGPPKIFIKSVMAILCSSL